MRLRKSAIARLLFAARLEGAHGRIHPDGNERGLSVVVQRHPDAIQPRMKDEFLKIVCKIADVPLLSRKTAAPSKARQLSRI